MAHWPLPGRQRPGVSLEVPKVQSDDVPDVPEVPEVEGAGMVVDNGRCRVAKKMKNQKKSKQEQEVAASRSYLSEIGITYGTWQPWHWQLREKRCVQRWEAVRFQQASDLQDFSVQRLRSALCVKKYHGDYYGDSGPFCQSSLPRPTTSNDYLRVPISLTTVHNISS